MYGPLYGPLRERPLPSGMPFSETVQISSKRILVPHARESRKFQTRMSSQKPTLVFCPGAWHSPDAFGPTTTLLEQAGYTCVGVALPTTDSELKGLATPQGWDGDVAAIRNVLIQHVEERGSDVVLAAHSYSGTVASEACRGLGREQRSAEGKIGGVVKLVYLCALILDIDNYVWGPSGGKPINEETTIMKGDLCYADKEGAVEWFYNECSDEQQKALMEKLLSHAWKAFMSKVTYTAWRDIPGVYLITDRDQAIDPAWQEAMLVAATGHRFEVERCDGDHSPFASRPEFTAKVIRKATGEKL